jgi:ribonuclease HI
MNVTITTDASFSIKHHRGTYAFFISSNLGRMSKSGVLRKKCESPSEAEMKCIINALVFLSQQVDIFSKCKDIYINTDSMNAIHMWNKDKASISKYKIFNLSKKMEHSLNEARKLVKGKNVWIKHVKSHDDTNTANRSRANAMCDNACRVEMGILISKLEK